VSDAISAALNAIAQGNYRGLPLAALAGVTTSFGPCVAPRYLALASLVDGRRRFAPVCFFTGGLVVTFVSLGFGASIVADLISHLATVYALLSIVLIAFGVGTLFREPHRCHAATAGGSLSSASGAFTMGAASALVVSPCCTPIVVGIAGLGAFDRDPARAALYLATFSIAHAAPLFLVNLGGSSIAGRIRGWEATGAPAVVTGALTVALGCYYGILA
jgi:thiol:disulfide interchange protein DsbD